MKTYISITKSNGFVAVKASNKNEAYNKIKESGIELNKGSVIIASVDISLMSAGIKKILD